jgi:hypothetical protein
MDRKITLSLKVISAYKTPTCINYFNTKEGSNITNHYTLF